MKKIVAGIAAIAMAASVFAVDVAGKIKIEGDLFSLDASSNVNVLKLSAHSQSDSDAILQYTVSSDKAGATFKIYNNSGAFTDGKYSIWFKPIDALKITVGEFGTNLNQETIGWWRSLSDIGSSGYTLSVGVDAFSLDVLFHPGWGNSWLGAPKDSDVALAETAVKVQYGADFGTVNGFFQAKDTFKQLKFGVGYKNNFSGVNAFLNVVGFFKDSADQAIIIEPFANGSIDAFSWAVYVPVGIALNDAGKTSTYGVGYARLLNQGGKDIAVATSLKLSYAINGYTPFLTLDNGNWLADSLALTLTVGVDGNVGVMSWEAAVKMGIGSSFTVNVPVWFSVSF